MYGWQLCDICSCSCYHECAAGDDDASTQPDACPTDPESDFDEDGICTADDACPFDANNDADSDLVCDATAECQEPPPLQQITVFGTCRSYGPGFANQVGPIHRHRAVCTTSYMPT